MTTSHQDLTATIRQALADTAATSPNYDTDTLATVIATAVDPDHEKSDPDPNPHDIADGEPAENG